MIMPGKESADAYILITPAKNERQNLPELIQSIASQYLKPVAWLIVDDNSNDQTPQIINKAVSRYPWIHFLRLDTKSSYDLGKHYAFVCRRGFDYALNYCKRNNIKFEYIALSDADMIYPKDYFSGLIAFLLNNSEYGIVGGEVLIKDEKGQIYREHKIYPGYTKPSGTGRVWRKKAFEETNGYLIVESPDAVSNLMALLKGWEVVKLPNVKAYQTRDSGGKVNLWEGYFNRGKRDYYLNVNPIGILCAIVQIVLISRQRKSIIKSLAYVSGYFQSFIRREKQIENDEVKRHVGSYTGLIRNYWLFLKGLVPRRRN